MTPKRFFGTRKVQQSGSQEEPTIPTHRIFYRTLSPEKHLLGMDVSYTDECRFCRVKEETFVYLVMWCFSVLCQRKVCFGQKVVGVDVEATGFDQISVTGRRVVYILYEVVGTALL